MYICLCQGVTDKEIVHAVRNGHATDMGDLSKKLGVAVCCGQCHNDAEKLLKDHSQSPLKSDEQTN